MDASPDPAIEDRAARPLLFYWLRDSNKTQEEGAAQLGLTVQGLGKYLKSFDDEDRQIPRKDMMKRIFVMTAGVCTPDTFYPPEMRPSGHVRARDDVA